MESRATRTFTFDFLGEYIDLQTKNLIIERTEIKRLCKAAWDSSGKGKTVVIFDEVDLYGKNDPYISFLYRYGRHKNIEIIAVARRFYDLPVIIRALTDQFYLFQITEERDINYLRRFISEETIQTLISLESYKYIIIDF